MREHGPFESHVREAIALNRERRADYVREGGWRAGMVSRILVGSERALLPVARRMDKRAEAARCGAFATVFSPMSEAPDPRQLVSGRLHGLAVCTRLAARLRPLVREATRLLARQPEAAEARLAEALHLARETARTHHLHLAMTVHLLESARLGASLAHGECRAVLIRFVRLHALGVPPALAVDALAAPLHARGVGVLANDLPPIPTPGGLAERTPTVPAHRQPGTPTA